MWRWKHRLCTHLLNRAVIDVICFAHLTNNMAQEEGDFEKGDEFGSLDTLRLISQTLEKLDVASTG